MSCGCGCNSPKTTAQPVIVHVHGLQGPRGQAGTGGAGDAVRYGAEQNLTSVQKAQARDNIGAADAGDIERLEKNVSTKADNAADSAREAQAAATAATEKATKIEQTVASLGSLANKDLISPKDLSETFDLGTFDD